MSRVLNLIAVGVIAGGLIAPSASAENNNQVIINPYTPAASRLAEACEWIDQGIGYKDISVSEQFEKEPAFDPFRQACATFRDDRGRISLNTDTDQGKLGLEFAERALKVRDQLGQFARGEFLISATPQANAVIIQSLSASSFVNDYSAVLILDQNRVTDVAEEIIESFHAQNGMVENLNKEEDRGVEDIENFLSDYNLSRG